jgi:hypothetical protein
MANQRPFTFLLSLLSALLLTSLLLLSGLQFAQAQSARMLVLGDSISSGYGMKPEQGWVNQLKKQALSIRL